MPSICISLTSRAIFCFLAYLLWGFSRVLASVVLSFESSFNPHLSAASASAIDASSTHTVAGSLQAKPLSRRNARAEGLVWVKLDYGTRGLGD